MPFGVKIQFFFYTVVSCNVTSIFFLALKRCQIFTSYGRICPLSSENLTVHTKSGYNLCHDQARILTTSLNHDYTLFSMYLSLYCVQPPDTKKKSGNMLPVTSMPFQLTAAMMWENSFLPPPPPSPRSKDLYLLNEIT